MSLMGFMAVNKPRGLTSHDVVARLRRLFHVRRIGHGGTLDPIATGVLPIAVGEVTRLFEYIPDRTKVYLAEVTFGIGTETLDTDGEVIERRECPEVTREVLLGVLGSFVGKQEQVPPQISAKHHQGRRLYQWARAGYEVTVPPKSIQIDRFELEAYTPGPFPKARFVIQCSEGTYVRALARDLGAAVGAPAVLSWLERIRSGPFRLEAAATLEALEARLGETPPEELFLPWEEVLPLPKVLLGPKELSRVLHGNAANVPTGATPHPLGSLVLLQGTDRRYYGVGMLNGCVTVGFVSVQPVKILSRERGGADDPRNTRAPRSSPMGRESRRPGGGTRAGSQAPLCGEHGSNSRGGPGCG